jgi:glyoxylase-like metal-dependent hydrolase (beta-lactamase superfamily II)
MRIHHLNCGSMCPVGGAAFDGYSRGLRAHLVCHCLLVETDAGLVMVDTGLGLMDVRAPKPRLSAFFVAFNNIQLREEDTARRQVERLGFKPADVRHIVLTHLDFDHAGGIEDFPGATVHVLGEELRAAQEDRGGFIGKRRYRPDQWDDAARWETYRPEGEPWFGFESVRDLKGLPPEILMVPLPGHTRGHAGVAISTGPGDAGSGDAGPGWLLHAGDAYFHHGEMDPDRPHCPPGLRGYQRMMEVDRAARLANQRRLRELVRAERDRVRVICGHDKVELERCSG